MRKIFFTSVAIICFFASCKNKTAVGSNGVEFSSAQQYNDFIISKQKSVVSDMTNYGNAAQIKADSAEQLLDKAVANIDKILTDIKGMPAYNSDSSFRDAAIELFTFYKKSFSTDFKEMLDINRKVEKDQMDESDIARFKQIQESISKQENPLDAKLNEMQTHFATENKLSLSDNSAQDQVDKLKQK